MIIYAEQTYIVIIGDHEFTYTQLAHGNGLYIQLGGETAQFHLRLYSLTTQLGFML